jgi:hypothetical protein
MRLLKISALTIACLSGALALSPARAMESENMGPQAHIEHMCADQGKSDMMTEHMAKRGEMLAEHLHLTDAQKTAFKELQDVRAKSHADALAAMCSSKPDLSTFEKRIAFHEAMLQRHLDNMKAEAPKLIAFYNSLDDKQKAEFDHMRGMAMEGGHPDDDEDHGEHHHHHHHHHHHYDE